MEINADFSRRVVLDTGTLDWVPSPMPGVERKMLDRVGAESGHATSIVRYAPGSYFAEHSHPGGEEFLVLEGTFSDNYGDFPAGHYVRNPIGTRHKPHSDGGCTIFVKLWQFADSDSRQFHVDTLHHSGELHRVPGEVVFLLALQAGESRVFNPARQYEFLTLAGTVDDGSGKYAAGYWVRSPAQGPLEIKAHTAARLYLKVSA